MRRRQKSAEVFSVVVARQVDLGVRLSEVEVPSRSWLVRMTFFLLAQIVESGGGTARCLEILTNFINQITRVKRETKSSMRLYQLLSLVTSITSSLYLRIDDNPLRLDSFRFDLKA